MTPLRAVALSCYTRAICAGVDEPLISQNPAARHPVTVVNNPQRASRVSRHCSPTTRGQPFFHESRTRPLHGLFKWSPNPSSPGTNVFRDFGVSEPGERRMWMLWPEILANYAAHYPRPEKREPWDAREVRPSERS
jgi:hypothetical protein